MGKWLGGLRAIGSYFAMPAIPFELDAKPAVTFSEPTDQPISQRVAEMFNPGYGFRVARDEALSVPAVQRGRNLICGIATLPLIQRGPDRRIVPNSLLAQLDPDVPNVITLSQTLQDLLFEGISWWEITAQDFAGYPVAVRHLDVTSVTLQPPGGRQPAPLPSGEDPRGALVYVDGLPVPASRVIRFDSPNPGLLKIGGRAIKRAILLDQAAKMYANEPKAVGYFRPAPVAGQRVDPAVDSDVSEMLADFAEARRKNAVGYLPAAMEYQPIDQMSPADLQLVALQQQVALDIANAMGIDPEELGINVTSRVYQNAVDRRQDRINDTYAPYMRAITDRLSMGDVTRRGYFVGFDLDDYLKANPADRWAVYEKAVTLNVMDREEIREKEGLPAGAPPVQEASQPQQAINAHSYGADEPKNFFDVEVTGFTVDPNPGVRTISGVALPYGKIAIRNGRKYRFDHGSLQWSDLARVKLLRDHNYSLPLGRAVELEDTPDGFRVKFKVGRGDDGDKALALAEDGVLDGLSVGVDFNDSDTIPDPLHRGVTLVRRARLREVSLTAMPAFDDARVATVAASLVEEGKVTETPTEPQAPVPVGGPVAETFDAATVGRLLAAMNQNPVTATDSQNNTNDVRQTVNPTRLTAHVNEPQPYRFDRQGNLMKGSHDFSSDVFAGTKGDPAAMERALGFIREQFDVATTNVNELNPTRNRPDMYVDQRDFRYPVWDAINKGTLSDVTPFTFPKFSSAGSLVGDHTETNEPSSGTFVTTLDTVTPTAISGKVKITRETWDQGGNPQISNLLWRQMTKGWYEALEAKAVAVLDAADPADIALPAGAVDDQLDQALTAAFADLQFVRGGFTMDNLFTHIDLYKALVAAVDSNGRRLYPAIGPANAMGTVRSRFAALDINGIAALPAWALGTTGTVEEVSYLFDSESVHGWASAPQRIDILNTEVAHVYIGIWGYVATVISDINGVREVKYDPAP